MIFSRAHTWARLRAADIGEHEAILALDHPADMDAAVVALEGREDHDPRSEVSIRCSGLKRLSGPV